MCRDSAVKEFGEVFTPDSIVCDMVDLVEKNWGYISDEEYILKTYLEPSCGDGQFLIRLLERKLNRVKNYPIEERELALVKAVSSLYGVDIQEKNVSACKSRMLDVILGKKVKTFDLADTKEIKINLGIKITNRLRGVVESIINANIIEGNTLETTTMYEYEFKGKNVRTRQFEFTPNSEFSYNWKNYVDYNEIASILCEKEPETFNW